MKLKRETEKFSSINENLPDDVVTEVTGVIGVDVELGCC